MRCADPTSDIKYRRVICESFVCADFTRGIDGEDSVVFVWVQILAVARIVGNKLCACSIADLSVSMDTKETCVCAGEETSVVAWIPTSELECRPQW